MEKFLDILNKLDCSCCDVGKVCACAISEWKRFSALVEYGLLLFSWDKVFAISSVLSLGMITSLPEEEEGFVVCSFPTFEKVWDCAGTSKMFFDELIFWVVLKSSYVFDSMHRKNFSFHS